MREQPTAPLLGREAANVLEALYDSCRDDLFHLALSYVHSQADAEDIVQDVFLSIADRYLPVLLRLPDTGKRRAYLFTAVRNRAINMKTQGARRFEVSAPPEDLEALRRGDYVSDRSFSESCESEEAEELRACFARLGPIYQDVLYLYFSCEMSVREIADYLGCRPAAVRKRLQRGKHTLADLLGKERATR